MSTNNQSAMKFCDRCGEQPLPNEKFCAACKPQSEGGQGKWRYIETKCTAVIETGICQLVPHWKGAGDADEIRRIMKLASLAPVLRDALDAVMSGQLGGNVDYHADRFVDARAALASARGEGEGK